MCPRKAILALSAHVQPTVALRRLLPKLQRMRLLRWGHCGPRCMPCAEQLRGICIRKNQQCRKFMKIRKSQLCSGFHCRNSASLHISPHAGRLRCLKCFGGIFAALTRSSAPDVRKINTLDCVGSRHCNAVMKPPAVCLCGVAQLALRTQFYHVYLFIPFALIVMIAYGWPHAPVRCGGMTMCRGAAFSGLSAASPTTPCVLAETVPSMLHAL